MEITSDTQYNYDFLLCNVTPFKTIIAMIYMPVPFLNRRINSNEKQTIFFSWMNSSSDESLSRDIPMRSVKVQYRFNELFKTFLTNI